MVVGITFLLRSRGPLAPWKKVVTTISHRALFALASSESSSPANPPPTLTSTAQIHHDGGDGGGGGVVPWEEWGPSATRIISPSSFQWITAHAGQRWLALESDKLIIRDFSRARVRRALAFARRAKQQQQQSQSPPSPSLTFDLDGKEGNAVCETLVTVFGGAGASAHERSPTWSSTMCFAEQQIVRSELPFLETRVDAPGRAGSMVLTDGARLIAFVRTVRSLPPLELFLFFHDFCLFVCLLCTGTTPYV
jgi:hypothetical protein